MVVGSKTVEACDALHRKFKSFLALPKSLLNVTAFLAVVKDSLKVDASEAETFSDPHLEALASSSDQDADYRRTSYRRATNIEVVRPLPKPLLTSGTPICVYTDICLAFQLFRRSCTPCMPIHSVATFYKCEDHTGVHWTLSKKKAKCV
jgi:hypothetical protein